MTNPFVKIAGWLLLALGVLFVVADFWASEHTLHDFRNALKEGLFFCILGVFVLAHAGYTERIHQLEKENAALRAAKGEPGSSPGKALP
jgi:hypothetical protein